MRDKKEWDKRYDQDDLPWDTGYPDAHLMAVLERWPRIDGKVLEVGCGTGTSSIWMAQQGFRVTGMDISTSAIGIAEARAAEKGVACRFTAADFLNCRVDDAPFVFAFDRGCFHSTGGQEGRAAFVQQMASCLGSEGLWLSLIGNSDQIVEGKGPPRLSAAELTASVEPFFEILQLESCLLESRTQVLPRFWQCLMRVRKEVR